MNFTSGIVGILIAVIRHLCFQGHFFGIELM